MTEVTLVTEATVKDKGGLPCKGEPVETVVYAKEKSVVRTEFYQGMRAGITPKATFEMRQEDYELSAMESEKGIVYASKLINEGITYGIIRAYRKGKSKVELVCE